MTSIEVADGLRGQRRRDVALTSATLKPIDFGVLELQYHVKIVGLQFTQSLYSIG